jgi:trigger factor
VRYQAAPHPGPAEGYVGRPHVDRQPPDRTNRENGILVKQAPVTTSIETLDEVRIRLTVEAGPERVRVFFDRAARELAKQVDVPGFRKGKAPRRVVEQRVGTAAIAQAALEDALQDFYVEALTAESLDTVARPEVDVQHFGEEEGCAFTATVEVRPTIALADHHGIRVSHPEWRATEAEIDQQLDRLREQFAEVEVTERAAEAGDLVTVDLRVSVAGQELDSARVDGALYEVGSGGVTPELDRRIVGAAAGDQLDYEDALPADYPEHGGADATFSVRVVDVRSKRLPELDDDFADTAGGFDSLGELRDDVGRSITRRRVMEGRHQLRGVVTDAFVALHQVPVPPAMLEDAVHDRLHRLADEAAQFGGTLEELLALEGTSREDYEARLREQTEQLLTAQLVLDALAKQLGVTVQASDIDREFARLAIEHRMDAKQVARLVAQQGTLPVLVGDIVRRRAIDALLDAAEIDGGPDEATLLELGLVAPTPPVEAAADDDTETAED